MPGGSSGMRILASYTRAKADPAKGFIDGHISLGFETRYSRRIANFSWARGHHYNGKYPWRLTLPEGGIGPFQWIFCALHSPSVDDYYPA